MRFSRVGAPILVAVSLCLAATSARQSDLDDFMGQVLARRDENWKKLQSYILDERQKIDVRGPAAIPVWGEIRTFTWFIRDGFFVRSPVSVNGVSIDDAERRKAEDEFLKSAPARDQRADGTAAATQTPGRIVEAEAPPRLPADATDFETLLRQTRQPGFVDSAYFLRFKFEPGKYGLVGRERLENREVLRIEYYPERLFSHEQDHEQRRRAEGRTEQDKARDAQVERMLNKVSLVTLWVEPREHQIVRYTFDNVNLDFFPLAWLLRTTDLKATMNMGEAFAGVWLPRGVDVYAAFEMAVGDFSAHYQVDYENYRQATTGGRLRDGARPQ